MGYRPWGRKELGMTKGLTLGLCIPSLSRAVCSRLQLVFSPSSTSWVEETPRGSSPSRR